MTPEERSALTYKLMYGDKHPEPLKLRPLPEGDPSPYVDPDLSIYDKKESK